MEKPTYLYVIGREGGPVKIGISANPYSRVLELQTGCPFRLTMFYARAVDSRSLAVRHEEIIHDVYEENRLIGEWFDICEEQGQEAIETQVDMHEWFSSQEGRT